MAFGGASPQPAVGLPGEGDRHLQLQSLNADYGTVTLVYSGGSIPADNRSAGGILTVELSIKPMMGVLWLGVILALLGGVLAVWRRVLQLRV
jgi:cytochrome c biogenesis factor